MPDLRPQTLLKHYDTGGKVSEGGKKGATVKANSSPTLERDENIRSEARKLIARGWEFRSLAGILAKRYADIDGYPKSERQYRAIIKPLRDEQQ